MKVDEIVKAIDGEILPSCYRCGVDRAFAADR